MSSIQNLSENPLTLDQSLSVLENNTARLNALILNIHGAVARNKEKRRGLIAEACGVLEGRDAVDPLGGAHFVSGEYNRLREILDELERLP